MHQRKLLLLPVITLVFLAGGCSIEIPQTNLPTPTEQTERTAPADVVTATPQVQSTIVGTSGRSTLPVETIPVTWADLHLTGRLVYVSAQQTGGNPVLSLKILNLVNGQIQTIFNAPDLAWINSASVSPDSTQVIMNYNAPPDKNVLQYNALYVIPLDGSKLPELLFTPPDVADEYVQPDWSPDGRYVYFSHVNYKKQPGDQHYPNFEVYRMAYPDGQPEKIVEGAYWPRVSGDSSRLVYITLDPKDGKNKIFISKPDGSNARQVVLSGPSAPEIIDAPIFTPDGKSLLFSAPTPAKASKPFWWEKVLGLTPVEAHSVPSEWWQVSLQGGVPVQLTQIQAAGLFASLSPDKRHFVSYSVFGLFVMNLDTSGITQIVQDLGGIYGTVNWIP